MINRIKRQIRYWLAGIRGRSRNYQLAPAIHSELQEIVLRHRSPQEFEIYISLGLVWVDQKDDVHTFRLTEYGEGLRNRVIGNQLTPLDRAILSQVEEFHNDKH